MKGTALAMIGKQREVENLSLLILRHKVGALKGLTSGEFGRSVLCSV